MTGISYGKEDELKHLIRGIRENVEIYKRQLDKDGTADKASVGSVLGMAGALKVLGIYAAVDTTDLEEWLWSGRDWFELKEQRTESHVI